MVHSCDALIVCCIDFRFQKYIRDWTDKELIDKTYDLVGFAGSTKELDTVMKQVDISVELHHTKDIYLIHHEDCGAYGAEDSKERHKHDLKKARKAVLQKYPNVQVHLLYIYLNGNFEKVK